MPKVFLTIPYLTIKVAFVGISNWALDPAKMNRGIFVARGVPNREDLEKSAKGICAGDDQASKWMRASIPKLTRGYFRYVSCSK